MIAAFIKMISKMDDERNKTTMKTVSKRFFACLLLAALLLTALGAALPAFAVDAVEAYSAYEDAATGDLLYTADFSGTDGRFAPAVLNTDNVADTVSWEAQDSGEALSVTTNEMTGAYVGGAVQGLPLDETTVYTITYDIARWSDSFGGLYVDFNGNSAKPRGRNGFGGYWQKMRYMIEDGQQSEVQYSSFANVKNAVNPANEPGLPQSFRVVVNGQNGTLTFSALSASGQYVDMIRTEADFAGNTLYLLFRALNGHGDPVVFRNVNVYKGDVVPGAPAIPATGELLLDIPDASTAATGVNGAVYMADICETSELPTVMTYDAETGANTISMTANPEGKSAANTVWGGNTNLPLGEGNRYTISYQVRFAVKNTAAALHYDYAKYKVSNGLYMSIGMQQSRLQYGVSGAREGSYGYIDWTGDMLTPDADGYYHVAIEIDGYQVTVYINGVRLLTHSTLENPVGMPFTTDTLCIALQTYFGEIKDLTGPVDFVAYRNIQVWSGLTVSCNYVTVQNGGQTQVVGYDKTAGLTLPLPGSTGAIFRGWAVDGSTENLLPSGAMLPENAKQIAAVWGEDYLTAFGCQFRENEDGTQDMRVIGMVDRLDYAEVGYRMVIRYTLDGEEKTIEQTISLHYAYESLTAKYGTETITPTSLGYDPAAGYLTAFTIQGLPTDIGVITVELTAYSRVPMQTESVFQEETVVIELVNGELMED